MQPSSFETLKSLPDYLVLNRYFGFIVIQYCLFPKFYHKSQREDHIINNFAIATTSVMIVVAFYKSSAKYVEIQLYKSSMQLKIYKKQKNRKYYLPQENKKKNAPEVDINQIGWHNLLSFIFTIYTTYDHKGHIF